MKQRKGRRRRSRLLWVRELSRREIHALAGRLARDRWADGLSRQQEWLWDQVMVELAYRASHATTLWSRCTCWFCSGSTYFEHDVERSLTSQEEPEG